MPGDEHQTMNRTKNHARLAIISSTMSVQSRTMTRRWINKIPKCFSSPGDCKELSNKTRRSTHDLNQDRTKPWLTQPSTSGG